MITSPTTARRRPHAVLVLLAILATLGFGLASAGSAGSAVAVASAVSVGDACSRSHAPCSSPAAPGDRVRTCPTTARLTRVWLASKKYRELRRTQHGRPPGTPADAVVRGSVVCRGPYVKSIATHWPDGLQLLMRHRGGRLQVLAAGTGAICSTDADPGSRLVKVPDRYARALGCITSSRLA